MITIVTTPRPFVGHYKTIQRNAIQSWLSLRPKCEIILIGNDEGTAEVASEFGIHHMPDVSCSESGLPLMDSFLKIAQAEATSDVIAWLSSDIILMNDFVASIKSLPKIPFLLSAQRWDIKIEKEIDFSHSDWEIQMRSCIKKYGNLHPPTSGDLLVFSRGFWKDVPPFIIGRAMHDAWLFYKARSLKIPVIDATPVITIIHQEHEYSTPGWDWKSQKAKKHPEFLKNVKLGGGYVNAFTLQDSTRILDSNGLKRPPLTVKRFMRKIRTYPAFHPYLIPIFNIAMTMKSKIIK